jgi:uncharacterized protein HemX
LHQKQVKKMMHEQKEEGKKSEMMMMLFDKLSDSEKKALMLRKLEGKIMMKESKIKLLQHKVETLKTIRSMIEKM